MSGPSSIARRPASERVWAPRMSSGAGTAPTRLQGARDTVSAVAWNPLYPQLVTASFDGTLRFYTSKT